MGIRRILIIPEKANPQTYLDMANNLNCPEIVCGIPPVLKGKVEIDETPRVYEEITPDFSPPKTLTDMFRELTERVEALENKSSPKMLP